MAYRISFIMVGTSDGKVHAVQVNKREAICGAVPMAMHKLADLEEIRQYGFCSKCLALYHTRSEKEFTIIK